jgi:hypothetical protein
MPLADKDGVLEIRLTIGWCIDYRLREWLVVPHSALVHEHHRPLVKSKTRSKFQLGANASSRQSTEASSFTTNQRKSMILIANAGVDVAETNYWDSELARAGYCFLTGNAGAWRLLVPEATEYMLADARTGKHVTIQPSLVAPGQGWDIVFEDGTTSPFFLCIDKRQVDRAMHPRGECRFSVWTRRGKELDLRCTVKTK